MHGESDSFARRGGWWVVAQAVLMSAVFVGGWWNNEAWTVPAATAAGWMCLSLGGVLALLGFIQLGRGLTPFPRPVPGARLVTTGVYRLVRHPLYTSVFLTGLGWALARSSPVALVVSGLLLVFFDAKARHEERWLCERFPEYGAYARRVRRLLPWVY